MVDMLVMRGARINVMNRGDDTPLHLAASHGHRDIVQKVRCRRQGCSQCFPQTPLGMPARPATTPSKMETGHPWGVAAAWVRECLLPRITQGFFSCPVNPVQG